MIDRIGKPVRPDAGEEEILSFSSGAYIRFSHMQDCCEHNYPDFSSLDDTGFWEQDFDELTLEAWAGGVRINGYALACYSCQSGYYSVDLDICLYDKNRNEVTSLTIECEERT